jgi:signal transduction histidine kinase
LTTGLRQKLAIAPLKLHVKTTLVISVVFVAVLSVIGYFSDLAISRLSDQRERQQAQLVAIRVASTVEHHLKASHRRLKGRDPATADSLIPNWQEVEDQVLDVIFPSNPQLTQVRVFFRGGSTGWVESVTLPPDIGSAAAPEEAEAEQPLDSARVTRIAVQGKNRMITAVAPVVSPLDTGGPNRQIGAVSILFSIDETQSSAAVFRGLIWPLLLLAIIAITLITYLLFRQIVYRPIDSLLLAMSRVGDGDLGVEVKPSASDEIGALTRGFNEMLGRIREMTEQLSQEQRRLEERVVEATGEIAERKGQLEDANLRLFEMQRQLSQLERLAAAGQLAAQFAHEVGTPLNLISGHVQLLRARASDERMIRRLDVISGQIDRIATIVRSMLDSTRHPHPRFAPTNLNSLLTDILDAAMPTLTARNVVLKADLARTLREVEADPDQMQQVFINLVNNSLDAMPLGGTLGVSTRQEDDSIIVELTDSGEGIPADQLDLIFDPLFTTKEGGGTGLGLTIVKQIISEHQGSVVVTSVPKEGTTFRITLPLRISRETGNPAEGKSEYSDTTPTLAHVTGEGEPIAVTIDSAVRLKSEKDSRN